MRNSCAGGKSGRMVESVQANEREITMQHVILSSAKAQHIMAFNPTFSLISCNAFFFHLVCFDVTAAAVWR